MRQRFQLLAFALVGACALLGLTGCGGGGSNPSHPEAVISAQTSVAGVIQAWVHAGVYGNATGPEYQCDPSTDSYCILSFPVQYTNSSGNTTVTTDDIPEEWDIAAQADSNCSTGAAWNGTLGSGNTIQVICGDFSSGYVTASPASCTITTMVPSGQILSNCPSTVTLKSPAAVFPTGRALSYGAYSETANLELSSSPTASNTTSVVVPAPTTSGASALILKDPTTNQVIGAALFTLYTKTINSCLKGTNCGT